MKRSYWLSFQKMNSFRNSFFWTIIFRNWEGEESKMDVKCNKKMNNNFQNEYRFPLLPFTSFSIILIRFGFRRIIPHFEHVLSPVFIQRHVHDLVTTPRVTLGNLLEANNGCKDQTHQTENHCLATENSQSLQRNWQEDRLDQHESNNQRYEVSVQLQLLFPTSYNKPSIIFYS